MNTMLRWSPARQFHFHQVADSPFERFVGGAMDEAPERSSWLPAAEGRLEDGTYIIQLVMDNVLSIKGERKADHDAAGKDYFVREVTYGAFQRDFALPEGVDADHVEAKYSNGMLEVRVPSPRAATPRMIEVKAA